MFIFEVVKIAESTRICAMKNEIIHFEDALKQYDRMESILDLGI